MPLDSRAHLLSLCRARGRYLGADEWYLICAFLIKHLPHRPMFLYFDGYVHHFDSDAIAMLLADNIFVFALKSQDSDSDQLNDNGPNASTKANYCVLHDEWLSETAHAVPFSPYFLNPLLVRAWQKFEREANTIIVKAAEKVGIWPFNTAAISYDSAAVSKVYDLVAADKAATSRVASSSRRCS